MNAQDTLMNKGAKSGNKLKEILTSRHKALCSISSIYKVGMKVHVYNPITWEAETRTSQVQGHPQLSTKFEANQRCVRLPTHKQTKKQNQKHVVLQMKTSAERDQESWAGVEERGRKFQP